MIATRARLYRWQLARAKEVDESFRERAFLDLPEYINFVLVKPFTLRHLNILFKIQSPFIYGGVRKIEDVGVFLWVVSPNYDTLPPEQSKRAQFMAELVAHPHWDRFYRAIDRYLDRVFRDTPPSIKDGKTVAACYAAGIIHKLASAYGWRDQEILDLPLTRIFQYLKWIQQDENPTAPQFNPMQDKINARF